MTNEKKAREIGTNWYNAKCCGVPMDSDRVAEQAALEMAEWKDEQFKEEKKRWIEKAAEWLSQQDEMIGISFQEDFIERFKKVIKGE